MIGTVKARTQVGIDERRTALRLQLMATDVSKLFGQRMRFRREELHLKQREVADRIRAEAPERACDKQRVSDWERGLNLPDDDYKEAIVTALEVDGLGYFFQPLGASEQPDLLDTLKGVDEPSQLGRIEDAVSDLAQSLNDLALRLVSAGLIEADEPDSEKEQPPARGRRPKRAA